MPGLNIYLLAINSSELLGNKLVLFILILYIFNDVFFILVVLFSWVYIIHYLPISWWITVLIIKPIIVLKHNIAKLFSTVESKGVFGSKTNDPRLEMVLFKMLHFPYFLAVSGHFSVVASLLDVHHLLFGYSFLVSTNTWLPFNMVCKLNVNRPNDDKRTSAIWA